MLSVSEQCRSGHRFPWGSVLVSCKGSGSRRTGATLDPFDKLGGCGTSEAADGGMPARKGALRVAAAARCDRLSGTLSLGAVEAGCDVFLSTGAACAAMPLSASSVSPMHLGRRGLLAAD